MKTILGLQKQIILISALLLFSCSTEDKGSQSNDPNHVIENPNLSQNNSEIQTQNTWGTKSSISQVIEYNNTTYTVGNTNDSPTISQINFSGNEIWNNQIGFTGRDLVINSNYLITVGGIDTNSDNLLDRGKIKTFDLNGNVKNEITVTKTGYERVVLNAVTSVSSNRIAIAGFVENSSAIQYPFIKFADLDNDGNIITSTTNDFLILTQAKSRAVSITYGDGNLFILVNNYTQLFDEINNCSVLKFEYNSAVNIIEFASVLDINQENGLKLNSTTGKSLVLRFDNLFVFSNAETVKDPAPSGGGYWHSGFITKISGASNNLHLSIDWKKVINLTNKSERFYKGIVLDNGIYAVGQHSSVKYMTDNIQFSNGLLAKLDTNGNVIYNKTFGNKTTSSGFNTLFTKDGLLYLYGFTNNHNTVDYQNWFVKINQ